jgi:hypothetical protein
MICLRAAALLVGLFLLAPAAQGEAVSFSYSVTIAAGDNLGAWGAGPISLSQSTAADGSSFSINYGSGAATITGVAGSGNAIPGGADYWSATPTAIPVATFTTATLAATPGNFSFSAYPGVTLHLTDAASGASGDLTLVGAINGSNAPDGTSIGGSLAPLPWLFPSLTLGDHVYSVDVTTSFITLPPPGGGPVTLFAQVYVDRPDPAWINSQVPQSGPGINPAPEPSSLLLAGAALSFLTLAGFRRGRRH